MSVSTIITYGFGSYGTVYYIPTLGFDIGSAVADTTPHVDIELNVNIARVKSFSVSIARTLDFTGRLS